MKNNLKIILLIYCIFLRINAKAQSCTDVEEWLRKRHTVSNMTYGHPYTTFDRHNKLSFEQTIQNIRANIKKGTSGDPIRTAYQAIYTNATKAMRSGNGMSNDAVSNLRFGQKIMLLCFW